MVSRRELLGIAAGLALCQAATPVAAATTWDYYAFTGVTHPITVFLKGFADDVEKRTAGELKIVVRPAGELPFRATESVKATGQGLVQMGSAYAGFISGTLPAAAVSGHPFLVRTYDDLAKVWPIMQRYTEKEFEKLGVKVLFYFSWPEQNIFGVGPPIRTLDDFRGRKLRTTDSKQAEMLSRVGASSVTLTTAEVPVAMERGVMEGVLTAAFNLVGAKWYEFVKWAWVGEIHIGGPNYELVNLQAYNALDPKVRQILDETAADWQAKMLTEVAAMERDARKELTSKYGIELVQPTAEQIDALAAKMAPYWEEWAADNNAGALMKEVRTALGK